MNIFGIRFAPLNIPVERRLQTLAAGLGFATLVFGGVVGAIILLYLFFYTNHWPEVIIYLVWMYIIDKDICDRGGRRFEWVRKWAWWRYVTDYYPIRLQRVPWVQLDPKRNYLFCCFPHGILPTGTFSAFCYGESEFRDLFPNHIPYLCVLKQLFYFPILRDLMLAVGMCSVSSDSLQRLLGSKKGGNVVAVVVGGAEETFYAKPGDYHVILKSRKGFVKMALKHGTPLVPVFSFGEIDLFEQVRNPKGSIIRRLQEWMKKFTGVAFAIPLGRGYLQYSFGLVPLRKPVSTIVGQPIEVEKNPNPTQEEINSLHEKFVKQLTKLFEEQKHNYLHHSKNASLIIM